MNHDVIKKNEETFTCPNCSFVNNAMDQYCSNCGADLGLLRKAEKAMQTDPELIHLNERYAKYGKTSFIAGWTAVICLGVFWAWLEYDILEFLSTPAMLVAPITFIVWLINKIMQKMIWKKIDKKLTELTGINRC